MICCTATRKSGRPRNPEGCWVRREEPNRMAQTFDARLADQFDAVIHLDETHAVEPPNWSAGWHKGEPPETFLTGL